MKISAPPPDKAFLLWDGACGFCRWCVRWVEARDLSGAIHALPYQESPSPPMTDALRTACAKAVHLLLPGGEMRSAGRAVLGTLSLLGWRKTAATLSLPPLVWMVEALYRLAAKNRSLLGRFFSAREEDSSVS
ncbi:MAG: DCC1-like thiol-disulfide oxidoreductase family protein [bacterium]|nr:DCC1-like thiol-disulfide oxidoreductase family protein [bacterium]